MNDPGDTVKDAAYELLAACREAEAFIGQMFALSIINQMSIINHREIDRVLAVCQDAIKRAEG